MADRRPPDHTLRRLDDELLGTYTSEVQADRRRFIRDRIDRAMSALASGANADDHDRLEAAVFGAQQELSRAAIELLRGHLGDGAR